MIKPYLDTKGDPVETDESVIQTLEKMALEDKILYQNKP